MKKAYCTQNKGDCITCSLTHYGLDCRNIPINTGAPRKGTKNDRAMAAFDGFKGGQTVAHIKKLIGKELAEKLTGHELGLVMSAVNRAYHEGKASTGAEMIDNNAVWISSLDRAIEWTEVGAEYEEVTETVPASEYCPQHKVTKPVKIKDGELVPQFKK